MFNVFRAFKLGINLTFHGNIVVESINKHFCLTHKLAPSLQKNLNRCKVQKAITEKDHSSVVRFFGYALAEYSHISKGNYTEHESLAARCFEIRRRDGCVSVA